MSRPRPPRNRSPDSSKVAYLGLVAGRRTVEIRDLATDSTTVLATARPGSDLTEYDLVGPAWSPDGDTIAYVDMAIGLPGTYPLVAASGGHSTAVEAETFAPAWRTYGTFGY